MYSLKIRVLLLLLLPQPGMISDTPNPDVLVFRARLRECCVMLAAAIARDWQCWMRGGLAVGLGLLLPLT
jgi:hypothetical protein